MSDFKKPLIHDYQNNIEQYFIDLDVYYRHHRPNKDWIIKETKYIIHRSIFGRFRVPITRYLVNNKSKYIDDQLREIRFDYNLKQMIKSQFISRVSYCQIAKNINFAYQKTNIKNIIDQVIDDTELNLNNIDFRDQKESQCIYVEVDDCYSKLRDNDSNKIGKYRHRLIVIHQGVDNGNVINKSIILENAKVGSKSKDIDFFKAKIMHEIETKYNVDNPKIVFISDGARWMKKLAKALKSEHVLDKYHILQNIKNCFKILSKNQQFKAYFLTEYQCDFNSFFVDLVRQNQPEKIIKFLYFLLLKNDNYLLSFVENKQINKLIRYIQNNIETIKNNHQPWSIGSRTEAFISHYVKKNTHKKFAVFSEKIFEFLIKNQQNNNTIIQFI